MGNKDDGPNGEKHSRPCFFCFEVNNIYWMVPISHKVDKYKRIVEEKKKKRPNYDGIEFGFVNGQEKAFLIQNTCPVTEEYIDSMYTIEHGSVEVTIDEGLEKKLNKIVRKVVKLQKKNITITLTDISYILSELNLTL